MKPIGHPATIWPGLCLLALATHAPAQQAPTIVSPTARVTLEGSASTSYPLGRAKSRYQQLYQDLGAARMLKGHAYRRDAISSRAGIAGFRSEMMVQLSAAALAPAKASKTFANNAGASPSTVLPRTILVFPSSTKPTLRQR